MNKLFHYNQNNVINLVNKLEKILIQSRYGCRIFADAREALRNYELS